MEESWFHSEHTKSSGDHSTSSEMGNEGGGVEVAFPSGVLRP